MVDSELREFSSLGEEEDFLRLRAAEQARVKALNDEREKTQKAQEQAYIARYICKFTTDRPEIGSVKFLVNLKTAKVLARKEFDDHWSALENKYAIRWLRSDSTRADLPDNDEIGDLPQWFYEIRNVDKRMATRLRWRTRFTWLYLAVSQMVESFFGLLGVLIGGFFSVVFGLLFLALIIYAAYYVLGGINGLLEFGWKNLN